ncbi:uncharacterized protein T551_01742 [Pneumocystis jirovecii RU7]|uniref:Uncharacterized protein n=1 Tax=Pneumocystis jirovecii (strain RU7) TaxID=1408657 RepID=A0A0W4ZQ12_PNEJ7|nr:uncharacterized protein T551_01742 [Pneumocystis jirovecii RU7]KTW30459.1 hypothetical protein T551_01742 [Pneumocystis jirovecii RU7]
MDKITCNIDDNDTEMKLGILASIFPDDSVHMLLEKLIENDGSVQNILNASLNSCLKNKNIFPKLKKQRKIDEFIEKREYKCRCLSLAKQDLSASSLPIKMQRNDSLDVLKRTNTHVLHLYFSEQIAKLTLCTLIPNVLPHEMANSLLLKMLKESETWKRREFRLFERNVISPHKSCYYLHFDENGLLKQKPFPEEMNEARILVKDIVNKVISSRKRLEYQDSSEWDPNFAVANLYANAKENVGYHSDELSYIGPMPTIACISLGAEREFRLKCASLECHESIKSIHLPHNSLLIMHPPCQEIYKHSIHPAHTITPHPVSGTARISITYRFCRKTYQPKYIPKCKCGVPCVLRCVQKKENTKGKYFWSCNTDKLINGNGKKCQFFQWAEFTQNGENLLAYQKHDEIMS